MQAAHFSEAPGAAVNSVIGASMPTPITTFGLQASDHMNHDESKDLSVLIVRYWAVRQLRTIR